MLSAPSMFCVIFDFSLLSLTALGIRTFEKRKAILSWLLNSVSEHRYRLEKCVFAIFSHDIINRIVFTNCFVSAWLIRRPVLSAKQRLNLFLLSIIQFLETCFALAA